MAFRLTTTEAIEAEAAAIKTKLRPHNNAIAVVFQENGFANVIASIDTIPNSPYIAIQNNDQAVCYNFSDVPSFVLPHAPITRYDFSNSPSIKLNTLNLAADYDMQTAISEVRLPANITELPPDCFAYCWSLSNINLENITKLGARAIRDCSNLDMSENFPPALEEIGADAVGSCQYSSENLELPTTLNTIHQYAFDNINGVKKYGYIIATQQKEQPLVITAMIQLSIVKMMVRLVDGVPIGIVSMQVAAIHALLQCGDKKHVLGKRRI